MPDVCLYFQVHLPHHLLAREAGSMGQGLDHLDRAADARTLDRVADECYLPANRMFQRLIYASSGRFRMALSLSGTAIELMESHRPDVLDSFRDLVAGGGVELLAEPYHHSLAFIHSNREFDLQVDRHLGKIEEVFHIRPRVFRNTELIYNDAIAAKAETMGFDGIVAEGVDRHLKGRSPNFLYRAPDTARIKTLLRNSWLSDDIGFRFADPTWPDYPLTAEKFASWLADSPGDLVNLFLGYETIGSHQAASTGIFRFWEAMPAACEEAGLQWVTPSEAVDLYRAAREYPCRLLTSWTDAERDLSAWTGNPMQRRALGRLYELEKPVALLRNPEITRLWADLQTSNHFHWMSTKHLSVAHHPYASPEDAFHRFMAAVDSLRARIDAVLSGPPATVRRGS